MIGLEDAILKAEQSYGEPLKVVYASSDYTPEREGATYTRGTSSVFIELDLENIKPEARIILEENNRKFTKKSLFKSFLKKI